MSDPITLLAFGQSNMLGGADVGFNQALWDQTALDPDVTFWNPSTQAWETAEIDPAHPASTGLDRGTNLAWHIGLELHARSGRDVQIIIDAYGGTPIDGIGAQGTGWVGAGTGSQHYVSLTGHVVDAGPPEIDLAVFAQGEANANSASPGRTAITTAPAYRAALDTLLAQLRAEPWFAADTPFLMPQLVAGSGSDSRNDVIEALDRDGDRATTTAYAMRPFEPDPGVGSSGVHWSVAGTPVVAARIVDAWEHNVVDPGYDVFAALPFVEATAGIDRPGMGGALSYLSSDAPVTANLTTGQATGGLASGDDLAGVIHLRGSDGADMLTGNDGFNRIDGRGGSDVIAGGAGRDWLRGGIGFDSLSGGAGNDILQGRDGFDTLIGGAGQDVLQGNFGNDSLSGGDAADLLEGGFGADSLSGGSDADTLIGLEGFDQLVGGRGNDWIYGNAGNDTLGGEEGADRLFGGIGADLLLADGGSDTLQGGDGFDVLMGEGGDDLLAGQAGNDTLDGGPGNDLLQGGLGADSFVFRAGADTVLGFQRGIDRVEIAAALLPGPAPQTGDLRAFTGRSDAGDLVLTFDADTTLTFAGITRLSQIFDDIALV